MKKILLILFILTSITLFASAQSKSEITSGTKVKYLSIETSNKSEMKNIKWDDVRDYFKDNNPSDSIAIKVTYLQNDISDAKNYKKAIKVSGLQSNIEELIATLNKMIHSFLSKDISNKD